MGLRSGASIRPSASGVQRSAPMACPRCSRTSIRRRRAADVRGSWKSAPAFSTIQTADLYGDGEQEIIADHEPSGTSVWRYTPPAGSKSINGGTWSLVSTTPNVLPTSPSPSQYLSLHAVDAGGGSAVITDQGSYWTFGGNGFHSDWEDHPGPILLGPELLPGQHVGAHAGVAQLEHGSESGTGERVPHSQRGRRADVRRHELGSARAASDRGESVSVDAELVFSVFRHRHRLQRQTRPTTRRCRSRTIWPGRTILGDTCSAVSPMDCT